MKKVSVLFMTIMIALSFGSIASNEAEAASTNDFCYAAITCANGETLSCKVDGPDCVINATSNSVSCTGVLGDGTRGTVTRECK